MATYSPSGLVGVTSAPRASTFVLLSVVVALLLAMQSSKQEQQPEQLRAASVRAKEFVLENTAGKAVARLKTTAEGTLFELAANEKGSTLSLKCTTAGDVAIEIRDAEGKFRTGLTLNSARRGEAGLWVWSGQGVASITSLNDGAPALRMHSRYKEDMIVLGIRKEGDELGGALRVRSPNDNSISLSANDNGRTILALSNTKDEPRLLLTVDDSSSKLTILDASQKAALGLIGLREGQVGVRIRDRIGVERCVLGTDADNNTEFLIRSREGKIMAGESK